jgi:hypothetical protein
MQFRSIVFGLSLFAIACAPPKPVEGPQNQAEDWNATVASIRSRASVEFSCAPQALELVLLSRDGSAPNQVGVRGCGKNGVYARHTGRGVNYADGTWTLAAVQSDAPASPSDLAKIELEQPYQ